MTTILYVEDNENNVYMLTRRLEKKGFTVTVAEDGVSGVARAQNEKPDLIIMDLILPNMDGWEATRKLKADQTTQHIPIIALSASVSKDDIQSAYDAGCDDVDTKPVDMDRLLGKIQQQLNPH